MLPGFRFLFVAIVLSMSVLVFGLGAATLFRAAHQEFASTPSWRAAPETMFAQQPEETPTLAMLRVDAPPATEQKAATDVAPVVTAVQQPTPNTTPIVAAAEPKVTGPRCSAAAEAASRRHLAGPGGERGADGDHGGADGGGSCKAGVASAPKPPETTSALKPETASIPISAATTSAPKPENAPPPQTASADSPPHNLRRRASPQQPSMPRRQRRTPSRSRPANPPHRPRKNPPPQSKPQRRWTRRPRRRLNRRSQPPNPRAHLPLPIAEIAPTMTAMLVNPPMPRPRPARASAQSPTRMQTRRRAGRLTAAGWQPAPASRGRQPSCPTRSGCRRRRTDRRRGNAAGQAGPVATGGPSGRPHSAHEPS